MAYHRTLPLSDLINADPHRCRQLRAHHSPPLPTTSFLNFVKSPPTPTAACFPIPPCFVSPRSKWSFDATSSPSASGIATPEASGCQSSTRSGSVTPISISNSTGSSDGLCTTPYCHPHSTFESDSDGDGIEEANTPKSPYHSVEMGFLGDGRFGGPPSMSYEFNGRRLSYSTSPSSGSPLSASPHSSAIGMKPATPTLFPTFGDFLPASFLVPGKFDENGVKDALRNGVGEDEATMTASGLGLGLSFEDERERLRAGMTFARQTRRTSSTDTDRLSPFPSPTRGGNHSPFPSSSPSSAGSRGEDVFPFSPFEHSSPTSDSFTFHPSPSFKSGASTTPLPTSPLAATYQDRLLPPLTPPRSRSSSRCSPGSRPPVPALPITPPPTSRYSPAPTFSPLPPSFIPSRSPVRTPPLASLSLHSGRSSEPYPLSPEDTELVARLHDGRIPTLEQLAPPETVEASIGSNAQPIINTGNHGPMVKQSGDWNCGACTFTNWRRRRICMRCFPFANDIGNALTIASHRPVNYTSGFTPPTSRPHLSQRPSLVPTSSAPMSALMPRSLSFSGPFGLAGASHPQTTLEGVYERSLSFSSACGTTEPRAFCSRQPLPPLPIGTPPQHRQPTTPLWTDSYAGGLFPGPRRKFSSPSSMGLASPEQGSRRDQAYVVSRAVAY